MLNLWWETQRGIGLELSVLVHGLDLMVHESHSKRDCDC